MGISNENGKYRGRATNAYGRRVNKMFNTREDAERWVAATKQEAALIKEAMRAVSGPNDGNDGRNKSGFVDSSLLASISQAGSISLDSKNPTATNKRTMAIPVLVSIEFIVLVSWFNLLITIRQTLYRGPFFDWY